MLKLSIRTKLFVAIFLACSVAIAAALGFFQYQFQRTYLEFVRQKETQHLEILKQTLLSYYAKEGSWEQLRRDRRKWFQLQQPIGRQSAQSTQDIPPDSREDNLHSLPDRDGPMEWRRRERNQTDLPPMRTPGDFAAFDIRRRTALLDSQHILIRGLSLPDRPLDTQIALKHEGKIIGYLGLYKRSGFSVGSEDDKFLKQQNKTLLIVALATLLGSLLVALLLSRQLVKPIRRLRQSTSELADGNYTTRIQNVGGDELGQLSADFNQLAERLQQNEQARRQWIMDIAHELRTPLSVLRGEIEAIQDGISQPNVPTIHSLHQETLHLQRLVEDLYTLSMSDSGALSYNKTRLDIIRTLRDTVASFENQIASHGLSLDIQDIGDQSVFLHADQQRLQQLFQNVLKNSLRYTDAPGKLHLGTQVHADHIEITVEDSAPCVPDESLPRLFERLYRVESSRNRATGGAGIGLSICYNIVQAHNGTLQAAHSELGGLKIIIRLPLTH